MIYLVMFICSMFFYYIAEQREKVGKIYKPYLFLAVILPIMLAALRDEHIGTDILWYLKRLYIGAQNESNIKNYLLKYSDFEYLFLILIFIETKIFKNLYFIQGIIHIFIIVPVFYLIWNLRNNINSILALTVFYFLFYSNTLNIMRQSIAVVLCLVAVNKFENKKYWQFIVWELLAIGFHRTAIINLVLVGIYFLMKSNFRKIYVWGILLIVVSSMLYFDQILFFLMRIIPIIPERYAFDTYLTGSKNLAMSDVVLYSVNLFTIYIARHDKSEWLNYLKVMTGMSFLSLILSYSVGIAGRIAIYWNYYVIFSMPQLEKIIAKNKISKYIFGILFFSFFLLYWYYNFVVLGYSEIYPYQFGLF